MALFLIDAKPLPQPMLISYWFDPKIKITVFYSNNAGVIFRVKQSTKSSMFV